MHEEFSSLWGVPDSLVFPRRRGPGEEILWYVRRRPGGMAGACICQLSRCLDATSRFVVALYTDSVAFFGGGSLQEVMGRRSLLRIRARGDVPTRGHCLIGLSSLKYIAAPYNISQTRSRDVARRAYGKRGEGELS